MADLVRLPPLNLDQFTMLSSLLKSEAARLDREELVDTRALDVRGVLSAFRQCAYRSVAGDWLRCVTLSSAEYALLLRLVEAELVGGASWSRFRFELLVGVRKVLKSAAT